MTAKASLRKGDYVRIWWRARGRFAHGLVIARSKAGITVKHSDGTTFIPMGRENPVELLERGNR